jgi:hypothetical protein
MKSSLRRGRQHERSDRWKRSGLTGNSFASETFAEAKYAFVAGKAAWHPTRCALSGRR